MSADGKDGLFCHSLRSIIFNVSNYYSKDNEILLEVHKNHLILLVFHLESRNKFGETFPIVYDSRGLFHKTATLLKVARRLKTNIR